MRPLLMVVNLYMLLVIAWAIMTWIPGVAGGPLHNAVGLPVVPVLNLFSFARVGAVGFQAMILLFILIAVQRWLERNIERRDVAASIARGELDPAEMQDAAPKDKQWWEDLDEQENREKNEGDSDTR